MNPYEKFYLRQKLVTAAVAVGAVAVVGGGVLLWQPWNRDAQEPDGFQQQQQEQQEQTPSAEQKEPDLTINVGGKKLDCMLYQGDGWTIPYPMDWTVEEGDGVVHFIPPESSADGTCVTVAVDSNADYDGAFIAIAAKKFADEAEGVERQFYYGADRGYAVSGKMKDDDWETYEKTMTAMARTMTVGTERPFASLYPMASEPEWQVVDNEVILFLDKDGIDIESAAEKAVKARMNSWSDDTKSLFTGKYRLGVPKWDSSYTCVSDDYVDVFCMTVEFQIVSGKADEIVLGDGQKISNGWLIDENTLLYIAVFHDGSVVTKSSSGWGDEDYFGAEFASQVLK